MFRGTQQRWAVKRAAFIALPLAVLVIVGTTVLVAHRRSPSLTLTAKVTEGPVSRMVTAKGVVSANKTANLNFKAANTIHVVNVKVGDKVKKGQKLGEEDDGGLRRATLQAQQALSQQQAALNLILNDYTVPADLRIWQRAKSVADQAWKNVNLKRSADVYSAHRQGHIVHLDEQAEDKAKAKLRADGCRPDGTPRTSVLPLPTAPTLATCQTDKSAVDAADLTRFKDATTQGSAYKTVGVDRGTLISTYRTARQAAVSAFNAYNIARINRPNQIQAQQALVANALVNIGNAQGNLANAYIYAPIDGTITAIAGTTGEYNQGGSNLTPNTPLAPGGSAKIPTDGDLAGIDQKNLTGGQGPNLGLQNVLPGGDTFIQMADINTFSVVAAFAQNDASAINPGSKAKVAFDAVPNSSVDGTVTSVSPIATPAANGTPMYYATVLLNKDQVTDGMRSGLTANVSVVTSTIADKAMVVPSSAVTEDDGDSYVEVPGPGGAPQKKMFTRGRVGDDNTQVVNGLKPGDTVLIPTSGPLPVPADKTAPKALPDQPLAFEHVDQPLKPATPAPADSSAAPAPTAPAPADPTVGSDTYPGDPGDLPDPSSGSGQNATPGGVNPFATPAAAPAAPGN